MYEELQRLENILKTLEKSSIVSPTQPEKSESSQFLDFSTKRAVNHNLNSQVLNNEENKILKARIVDLEETIKRLKENIIEEKAMNKHLKDDVSTIKRKIQDLKGNVRVYCRLKPSPYSGEISHSDNNITVTDKSFVLDHIFDQNATQSVVFSELSDLVACTLEGYNVCMFAYGQTGSGKTYTMEGTSLEQGILWNSFDMISKQTNLYRKGGWDIKFKVKYVEIYNEIIRDLFSGGTCQLYTDVSGTQLKYCTILEVNDLNEIRSSIKNANVKRSVGSTECNNVSSRSHSVLILEVEMISNEKIVRGVLNVIDLAGSERLSLSKAENERLKETQNINRSLSILGNVFNAIKRCDKHIPFRDSKLTHLMQNYLTGTSKTVMIVNIDPQNVNETICSLRFASKVSECALGKAERNIQNFK